MGGRPFQKLDVAREFARSNPSALVLAYDWYTMPYKDHRSGQWRHTPIQKDDKPPQPAVIKKFVVFRSVVRRARADSLVSCCEPDSPFSENFSLSSLALLRRRTGSSTKSSSGRSRSASTRSCRRVCPTATGW